MNVSDEEKLSLTMDVLKTSENILEEGLNIDDFLSHGIDLLSNLVPTTASGDEFRCVCACVCVGVWVCGWVWVGGWVGVGVGKWVGAGEEKKRMSLCQCWHSFAHLYTCIILTHCAPNFCRQFANQMARHFVTSSQSSLLFLIKASTT